VVTAKRGLSTVASMGWGWEGRSEELLWQDERWCEQAYEFSFVNNVDSGEGRDWTVRRREATWVRWGAAVHHHSLHRLNAINDYFKKKKSYEGKSPHALSKTITSAYSDAAAFSLQVFFFFESPISHVILCASAKPCMTCMNIVVTLQFKFLN